MSAGQFRVNAHTSYAFGSNTSNANEMPTSERVVDMQLSADWSRLP